MFEIHNNYFLFIPLTLSLSFFLFSSFFPLFLLFFFFHSPFLGEQTYTSDKEGGSWKLVNKPVVVQPQFEDVTRRLLRHIAQGHSESLLDFSDHLVDITSDWFKTQFFLFFSFFFLFFFFFFLFFFVLFFFSRNQQDK